MIPIFSSAKLLLYNSKIAHCGCPKSPYFCHCLRRIADSPVRAISDFTLQRQSPNYRCHCEERGTNDEAISRRQEIARLCQGYDGQASLLPLRRDSLAMTFYRPFGQSHYHFIHAFCKSLENNFNNLAILCTT